MNDSLDKRLYKFITHSEVLEKVSIHYNKMAFSVALDKARELKRSIVYHDYQTPKKVLAKMILSHEKSLYAILPSTKNTSYRSSLQKLQGMIEEARKILNPIYPIISSLEQNGITTAVRKS